MYVCMYVCVHICIFSAHILITITNYSEAITITDYKLEGKIHFLVELCKNY